MVCQIARSPRFRPAFPLTCWERIYHLYGKVSDSELFSSEALFEGLEQICFRAFYQIFDSKFIHLATCFFTLTQVVIWDCHQLYNMAWIRSLHTFSSRYSHFPTIISLPREVSFQFNRNPFVLQRNPSEILLFCYKLMSISKEWYTRDACIISSVEKYQEVNLSDL